MRDCAKDVLAFHDEKVTLKKPEQDNMRGRRDATRTRLKTQLQKEEKPLPKEFIKQGSYAMLTMVQDDGNDYDIDDGVYFTQASLKGPNGGDKTARDARQMICDALKGDDRFSQDPEVKKNCVRIFYKAGYHIDLPVYRIRDDDEDYELASGSYWVHSRAADVEEWFKNANQELSPDETNGRQFRRMVRLLKKFAKSRESWKPLIASGFSITILAKEKYVADKDKEDRSLRETMRGIYNRLLFNLEVDHPVTRGAKVTKGPDDAKMKFFRDKLEWALKELEVLDETDCTKKQALKAWDKVFNTEFFSGRYKEEDDKGNGGKNAAILANLVATKEDPGVTDKRGPGRWG